MRRRQEDSVLFKYVQLSKQLFALIFHLLPVPFQLFTRQVQVAPLVQQLLLHSIKLLLPLLFVFVQLNAQIAQLFQLLLWYKQRPAPQLLLTLAFGVQDNYMVLVH